jgi:hypothetical protein
MNHSHQIARRKNNVSNTERTFIDSSNRSNCYPGAFESGYQLRLDMTNRNWREKILPFLLFGIVMLLLGYFFVQQRVPFEDSQHSFWHRVWFFTFVIVLTSAIFFSLFGLVDDETKFCS